MLRVDQADRASKNTLNEILRQIAALLAEKSEDDLRQIEVAPVRGGCISQSFRLTLGTRNYFVKINNASLLPMFEAEQVSLEAIRKTQTICVPRPIRVGQTGGYAFLVMDYLEIQRSGEQAELGRRLAALHRCTADRFGWSSDNFIGPSLQRNPWSSDWPSFFAEQRLQYQITLTARRGKTFRRWPELKIRIADFFDNYSPVPSLLHGDLWGGNIGFCDGLPIVFDPACYHGDRETDLAFSEMFGGFTQEFYQAYESAWPLDPGYHRRKKLYNLYHVLNHFNLFGGSYGSEAEALIESLCKT